MAKHTTLENISRLLEIIKLISQEGGATVTEISKKTGIDRWTVKDMIDELSSTSNGNLSLPIQELKPETDKRQTIYYLDENYLWPVHFPKLELSSEESILLSLMFSKSETIFRSTVESLKDKLNMFTTSNYTLIDVMPAQKIADQNAKLMITSLLECIKEKETSVCISYKPIDKASAVYKLHPLAVFKYGTGFYLAAQKYPSGEFRIFSIERILVDPEGSICERIEEKENEEKIIATWPTIDIRERLSDPFGPFGQTEPFDVKLVFDKLSGFLNSELDWPSSVKITKLDDESINFEAKTRSVFGIIKFVKSFGASVKVIEPKWLRDEIAKEVKKLAELYL